MSRPAAVLAALSVATVCVAAGCSSEPSAPGAPTVSAEPGRDDGPNPASDHRVPAGDRDARLPERQHMRTTQLEARGIRDPRVLAAMTAVPREWFVPESQRAFAYADSPLPIAEGQTISQPYIVALMTEAVALQSGARVLEIGTGSGYQAAVLAELTPHVFSIEYVPALAASAELTLRAHGYRDIALRQGDGYVGWPEAAPFDAILVTAAPPAVPQPLIDQLAPGGRLCIPVDAEHGNQELLLLTKQPDGSVTREFLIPVRFVPMVGEARAPR